MPKMSKLSTITVDERTGCYPPTHPGEMLMDEFLEPMEITPYRLAKDLKVPLSRVTAIIEGRRGLTADTALRLARYFNMAPQFWMNLQSHYELESAKDALGDRLDIKVKPLARRPAAA